MGYYSYNYDELYHHGIKGQKWGVRRFQNKDGSMTSAGKKKRYDNDESNTSGKKGLSKKQKIAIGVGIAAVAAVGAYAAGVKIADVKANKEANAEIADLLNKAHINADIGIANLRSTSTATYMSTAAKRSDGMKTLNSVNKNAWNAYANGDMARRISNAGRRGKKVKLTKENLQSINELNKKIHVLDNERTNLEYASGLRKKYTLKK